MRKALLLTDYNVKRAMQHPTIKGKKPIGRGVFSAVFEGSKPDRVAKLTVDPLSYWMLNDPYVGLSGKHFPKVFENSGEVGYSEIFGLGCPIYLYEIEKLKPVRKTEASRLARKITKAHHYGCGGTASRQFKNMAKRLDGEIPSSLTDSLLELSEFCEISDADRCGFIDLHLGNYMARDDGELVFTDPICNLEIISGRNSHLF
jgi:hypothetical protein